MYYQNWWNQSWNQHRKGAGKAKQSKKDQGKDKQERAIFGYDGTKIALDLPSEPSSSQSVSTGEAILTEMKDFLREAGKRSSIPDTHPLLKRLGEEEERENIREQQKQLNAKRKWHKKLETLQKQRESKELAFQQWRSAMKDMLKQEAERREVNMKKIDAEIERLQTEEEEKDEKNSTISSDDEMPQPDSREIMDLRQRLQASEDRFQLLAQSNYDLKQQMSMFMQTMSNAAMMPVPDPEIITMPPYVASPSHPSFKSDAMKPFGKTPKQTHRPAPYLEQRETPGKPSTAPPMEATSSAPPDVDVPKVDTME